MAMPIYEYRCEACDKRFERLARSAERDQAQPCPACESRQTHVLVSSFAALGSSLEPLAGGGAGCACGGSCACGSKN